MELKAFIRSVPIEQRAAFAARCGCTLQHLRFVAYGAKSPSSELAIAIERETGGAVTVTELRPDFAQELRRSGYTRSHPTPTQDAA